jgi:carbamoyltransferase
MYLMGINTGMNASAVIMKDNKVVFGIQEERISRIKNQPGFPKLAIEAGLKACGITMDDIDYVCMGGKNSKVAMTRQDDLNKFNTRYGKIKASWFGETESVFAKFAKKGFRKLQNLGQETEKEKFLEDYLDEFNIADKTIRFDHHSCHAASAYYGLAKKPHEKYLIFSLDGGGDGRTSAVFEGYDGQMKEIASSDSFSPACLYAHITYILGFLPHEHEYKLMGLAPYAQPQYAEVAKDILYKFIGFDKDNPMCFNNTEKYPDVRNSRGEAKQQLIEDLFKSVLNLRFDTLAAGLQMLAEEVAVKWIKESVKKTGIKRVLLSGGFFMNVKANKLIAELPEVEFVNCFPSCGDETNAFGAVFLGYLQNKPQSASDIEFSDFCIGTDASFDIEEAKTKYKKEVIFRKSDSVNDEVADMLCNGQIVARCSGKMEFGARALGNRSILASPDDIKIINKINAAIKKRDFWMPFAPAMIQEKAETLIDIPKSLQEMSSPYMMFTFQAKADQSEKFLAGIHQSDKTARAQIINAEIYPEFHDIITKFNKKSGIPSVLNTSFNLHGFPIVLGACDAVDVYLNSALDVLVVDDYIITRK